MNYYTNLKELNRYREVEYLSQSYLKKVLSNNTKPFKETIPMLLGSYLDALLTSPHLKDDLFIDELDKRPSETIRGFLISLFETLQVTGEEIKELSDYREIVVGIARNSGYQPKWGDDALWNSIEKDGSAYWEFLIKSEGKSILTKEERDRAINTAQLTLSHHLTGKYFLEQPVVDKYYQLPVYWESGGEPCKGLIDLLIVEHVTKRIYLIDIKSTTVGSIEEWFKVARSKNYPFQLAFYKEGVETYQKHLGYTIECKWIVLPITEGIFKPWIIPCTDLLLEMGKEGYSVEGSTYKVGTGQSFNTSKKIYGYRDAIEIYKESKRLGILDFDLLYETSKGKMDPIDVNEYFFT